MDAEKVIREAMIRLRISVGWHIDNWVLAPLAPHFAEERWKKAMRNPSFCGVAKRKRKEPLIVSLTSFPPRIEYVPVTIKTLLTQTLKPDMLILYLAEEEFPGKEADLPEELKELVPYGLTIKWCRNDRSFKKLIPALKEYPEAVIITMDDDTVYHPAMVQRLYAEYVQGKSKKIIYCHRAAMLMMRDGDIEAIVGGYVVNKKPSYLNRMTGVGGVLYPPHCLDPEVMRREMYMTLAPMNDDVWFWAMAVRDGTRVKALKHRITMFPRVKGSQQVSLIGSNSVDQGDGQNLTQKQMLAVLEHYPEVKKRLEEEWNREST